MKCEEGIHVVKGVMAMQILTQSLDYLYKGILGRGIEFTLDLATCFRHSLGMSAKKGLTFRTKCATVVYILKQQRRANAAYKDKFIGEASVIGSFFIGG